MPKTNDVISVSNYTFRVVPESGMKKYLVTGKGLAEPVEIYLHFLSTYSLEKSAAEILQDASHAGELDCVINDATEGRWDIPHKEYNTEPETVSLIIRRNDAVDEECFLEYKIHRDFLVAILQGESLENFLNTYTADDSQTIYEKALRQGAVLQEVGSLEADRYPDDFPYRYIRIENRAQLKKMLSKGALIKFIRHHWRKRLDLFSEVVEVHGAYVMTTAFKNPHLLLSQGNGFRFDVRKASYYEFRDTITWYNRPINDPNRRIIAEFYILVPV